MHNDILISGTLGVSGLSGTKGPDGVNPPSDGRKDNDPQRKPGENGNDTSANSGSCQHKCKRALDGEAGANGTKGGTGINGEVGGDAPLFILRVGTIPTTSATVFLLSQGGAGGHGGAGGKGGTGAKGGDAGINNAKCLKKHSNWQSLGGDGGNGGNGGKGGNGGPAGNGGNVYIYAANPTAVKNNLSAGSQAGGIGDYGVSGKGGAGGKGGLNEKTPNSPKQTSAPDGQPGIEIGPGAYGANGTDGRVTYLPIND